MKNVNDLAYEINKIKHKYTSTGHLINPETLEKIRKDLQKILALAYETGILEEPMEPVVFTNDEDPYKIWINFKEADNGRDS